MFKDYNSLNNSLESAEDEIINIIKEIQQVDVDNLMDEAEYNKCKDLAVRLEAKFSLHEFLIQEIIK